MNEEKDSVAVISSDNTRSTDVQVSAPGNPKPTALRASTNSGSHVSDSSDFRNLTSSVLSRDYDYEPERSHHQSTTYHGWTLVKRAKTYEELLQRKCEKVQESEVGHRERSGISLCEKADSVVGAQSYKTLFLCPSVLCPSKM